MFSAATKSAHGPATAANYIEDVFSTYLYTGTEAIQTITNGINLSTKGGLTWIKSRSAATNNNLFDTTQGATKLLHSNTTGSLVTNAVSLTAFNSTGFTLGTGSGAGNEVNVSAATYCSWTFRKQAKFFDVVTYTGTGANRTITHNLGSVPGMIIIKRTDTTADWQVYHRSLANTEYLVLNTTAAVATGTTRWNSTTPTSSVFSVGTDATVNASGGTYVAYLFANNAGGFGTTGSDNVISCGSFTTDGSGNATVNLGWEPQYVLIKESADTGSWYIMDVMRGMSQSSGETLQTNLSAAEVLYTPSFVIPNATGFTERGGINASSSAIYMAIRRPMKVPTDATTVFSPNVYTPASPQTVTTNFASDLLLSADNAKSFGGSTYVVDRLRGDSQTLAKFLDTTSTTAEASNSGNGWGFDNNTAIVDNIWGTVIGCTQPVTYWNFSRRPGFFDEVCYTGTGSATTQAHNLGVAPELIITKIRNGADSWYTYSAGIGNTKFIKLDTISAASTYNLWNNTTPTSSVFSLSSDGGVNASSFNYVAYLFATCAGVSKVGSYTGTGATQTINCGFTGGARFVLIKRTDSTGDWYVWDTARGMVSGTDPSLLLNSTAAEVNANSVYTATTGFQIVSTAAGINASGGSYIFLAIA